MFHLWDIINFIIFSGAKLTSGTLSNDIFFLIAEYHSQRKNTTNLKQMFYFLKIGTDLIGHLFKIIKLFIGS